LKGLATAERTRKEKHQVPQKPKEKNVTERKEQITRWESSRKMENVLLDLGASHF
jgi:hypothetical protein